MRIGSITIDPAVALAPMSGITDRAFRVICRELGAGLVFTGLVSANALHYGGNRSDHLLAFAAEEHPVAAQVFGADPELVAAAAREAEARGADLVDINMGCAVPKVLKARAGALLMADPTRAEATVRAAVAAVRLPVTVKLRRGWHDRGETAVALAQRCEQAGAAAITVHPRWASQHFHGEADWSVIAEVKRALRVPVIGNGDLHDGASALRMLERTGCDGVMVGRATLGNPWIFREVAAALRGELTPAPPTLEEWRTVAARHLDLAIADRGEAVGVREMRKHIAWYLRGKPGARALREQANRATKKEELLAVLGAAAAATALH